MNEAFSRCLVEGDEAAVAQARRRRRKAFLISLVLEAALLALLLFPLLVPSARPSLLRTPLGPLRVGFPGAVRQTNAGGSGQRGAGIRKPIIYPTVYDRFRPPTLRGAQSPVVSAERSDAPNLGNGPGDPNGIPLPGMDGGLGALASGSRLPVAPSPREQRPHRVSEGVQEALLVHRVQPIYPPLALRIRLEGTVHLRAIIGRDGAVNSLGLISGHPILVQASRSKWKPTSR